MNKKLACEREKKLYDLLGSWYKVDEFINNHTEEEVLREIGESK